MATDEPRADQDDQPDTLNLPLSASDPPPEWVDEIGPSPWTDRASPDRPWADASPVPTTRGTDAQPTGFAADGQATAARKIADRGDDPSAPGAFRSRFRRGHLHGRGGIGRIWWATDRRLGQEVALKEIRPDLTAFPLLRDRFLREARITAQLAHPGIVPILDLDEGDDHHAPAFVMRFVAGPRLSEAARADQAERAAGRRDPLSQRRLLQAFVTVCETVAYAHARGVLHRDLKGANVVLGGFGEVIVLDWGLAKLLGRPADADRFDADVPILELEDTEPDCTRAGQVVGTPGYAPPEQLLGQMDRIDRRSDVFGLGAILYEILTGRPPFAHNERAESIRRTCESNPERPRSLSRDVPRPLEAICLKALAKEPDDRYPSASMLAADVQRFLADEPVTAYREPWWSRLARAGRRHRTALIAAIVLFATAFLALSIATWRIGLANRESQENFRVARQTARDLVLRINAFELAQLPGGAELRLALARETKVSYQQFLQSRFVDREVRFEAVEVYRSAGSLEQLFGLLDLARVDFQTADYHLARLQADFPDDDEVRHLRSFVLAQLGNTHHRLGRPDEALVSLRQSLALARPLLRADPGDDRRRRALALALGVLMEVEADTGQEAQAIGRGEEAVALLSTLVETRDPKRVFLPDAYRFIRDLVTLSQLYAADGRDIDADQAAARALAVGRRLMAVPGRASEPDRRYGLAVALAGQARRQAAHAHRRTSAGSTFDEAIAQLDALRQAYPRTLGYELDLAACLADRGDWLAKAGRPHEAENDLNRALEIRQTLAERSGHRADPLGRLGQSHGDLGRLLNRLGRPEEARTHLARAIELERLAALGSPPSTAREFQTCHDRDAAALHRIERMLGSRPIAPDPGAWPSD